MPHRNTELRALLLELLEHAACDDYVWPKHVDAWQARIDALCPEEPEPEDTYHPIALSLAHQTSGYVRIPVADIHQVDISRRSAVLYFDLPYVPADERKDG